MSTKKHHDHPHLTGEHKLGDMGQLILLFIFLCIWITDSFIFRYSTFLSEQISNYIRIPFFIIVGTAGWYLARGGVKLVFGTRRDKPEVIQTGVFRVVRHPIYSGAILFYLAAILITMSIASAAFWILIILFYVFIARYEEGILTDTFGEEYNNYKKKVGMLFPRLW